MPAALSLPPRSLLFLALLSGPVPLSLAHLCGDPKPFPRRFARPRHLSTFTSAVCTGKAALSSCALHPWEVRSLSLPLSDTHTHGDTHRHTHSHARTHSLVLSLSLPHTQTHRQTYKLTCTHLVLSPSLSLSHTHSHARTHTPSFFLSLSHTQNLSHSLTHTHSLSHALTRDVLGRRLRVMDRDRKLLERERRVCCGKEPVFPRL